MMQPEQEAPLIQPRRRVYLPAGEWIDYRNGKRYLGPEWRHLVARSGQAAILVRGGAIVPMGPILEYMEQKPFNPLTLDIYPSGESSFTLYEDDGDTYAYESGASATTRFTCREERDAVSVGIAPTRGAYDAMPVVRDYVLQVHGTTRPQSVIADGRPLIQHKTRDAWEQADAGWWYTLERDEKPTTGWYARKLFVKLPGIQSARGSAVRLEGAVIGRYYQ